MFCEVLNYSGVDYAAVNLSQVAVYTDDLVIVWVKSVTILIYGGDKSFVPGVREVAYIYYKIIEVLEWPI